MTILTENRVGWTQVYSGCKGKIAVQREVYIYTLGGETTHEEGERERSDCMEAVET